MNETRDLLERVGERFTFPDDMFERLGRRRDRKRRNQRIAAGVVGIAVFVAAVWIVTNGLSLDRSTPAVPGSKTGSAETAPSPARASAAQDVVRYGTCSGDSRSRLVLKDLGDKIRVRFFVVFPDDYPWRIVLWHGRAGSEPFNYGDGRVFFVGTRVDVEPYISVDAIAVRKGVGDLEGDDGFAGKAVDQQTGQVCKALGVIKE